MSDEHYAHSLQENIITMLAYAEKEGRVVALMLEPALMDGDYRLIAERCVDYWRKYNEAPGDHTADLMDDIIADKHNRRRQGIMRVLKSMVQLSESINTQYVLNQLRTFNRLQRFKGAIIQSAEKLSTNSAMALEEVEEMWQSLIRSQERDFDAGMGLFDYDRLLARMRARQSEFSSGVEILDKRGVTPARGEMFLVVAPAGRGKTWCLVNIGKKAILERKRVIHFSCEMDEEQVALRYYQSLFSVPKREGKVEVTEFVRNLGELEGLERHEFNPQFTFEGELIRDELMNFTEGLGKRLGNLVIKRYPPHQLSPNIMRAYLDTLEQATGFIPDMIILDYLGISKVDPKNLRLSLGFNTADFRAVGIERNAAFVTAHQSSKEGENAQTVKGSHIAEDWSIVGTADVIVTYSCSDKEFEFGLGRLYIAKCRAEEDRWSVVITQSYTVGQFCLDAHYLDRKYWDYFKTLADDATDVDEIDEEE